MKKKSLHLWIISAMILLTASCKKSLEPVDLETTQAFPNNTKKSSANELASLKSNFSRGFGINNSGAMTGSTRNADGKSVAFLLKNNDLWFSSEEVSSNGLPEIRFSINDPGDVAGHKIVPGGIIPVVWKNGQVYELEPLPGQQFAEVYDINNAGQMVGESLNGNFVSPSTMRATVFSLEGDPIDLGTLGGAKASAAGINEDGDIVGLADNASGQSHAFLYKDGVM